MRPPLPCYGHRLPLNVKLYPKSPKLGKDKFRQIATAPGSAVLCCAAFAFQRSERGRSADLLDQTVGSCRRYGFRTSDKRLRLACRASASTAGCVQGTSYACETRPLLLLDRSPLPPSRHSTWLRSRRRRAPTRRDGGRDASPRRPLRSYRSHRSPYSRYTRTFLEKVRRSRLWGRRVAKR